MALLELFSYLVIGLKIINLAKKYGWTDENIIKINLPRWDKYNNKNDYIQNIIKLNSNSIFMMFTWREELGE